MPHLLTNTTRVGHMLKILLHLITGFALIIAIPFITVGSIWFFILYQIHELGRGVWDEILRKIRVKMNFDEVKNKNMDHDFKMEKKIHDSEDNYLD